MTKRSLDPPGKIGNHVFVHPDISTAIVTATKAGSTSVLAWFNKYVPNYYRRRADLCDWQDWDEVIAIVRSPYSRIRSIYDNFIRHQGTRKGGKYLLNQGFHLDMTFAQFLGWAHLCQEKGEELQQHMKPQFVFFMDKKHRFPDGHIQCERLNEDWRLFFPNQPIGHSNQSRHYPEHPWTRSEISMVEEMYSMDFFFIENHYGVHYR